jgi:Transposase DDE domain group 1
VSDCATQKISFETPTPLALEAAFDGGRITSDGGLTWLAEVDRELGVCEAMSQHLPEWRKRRGQHSMLSLLRQRVYQIACG